MIALFAGIFVVLAIPLVCKLAVRAGFMDVPHGRKQHDVPVPPLGGFVIFSVFLMAMALFGGLLPAVFSALGLILVVGLIDDAYEVHPKIKFAVHFTAAFLVVLAGKAQLHSLGDLLGFGDMSLGVFAIPFSVACVVYIQNAINMMDGVDGLAGGISLIMFAGLWGAAFLEQNNQVAFQLLVLMACLSGFLMYNMRSPFLPRAKIFLGDAGSMALGIMIAWYAITLSQGPHSVIHPVSVAWMLALVGPWAMTSTTCGSVTKYSMTFSGCLVETRKSRSCTVSFPRRKLPQISACETFGCSRNASRISCTRA